MPSGGGHFIRAIRRQKKAQEPSREIRYFLSFRIDLNAHELFDRGGGRIDLSEGELAVLRVFVERPRRMLSRNDLLMAARGPDAEAFDRAVDVQVYRLRRKLGTDGSSLIRTVRNEGYIFVPKVTSRPGA